MHVTFLVLLVLVAAGARAAGQSAVGEVVWLLALFACVVAHELSHSMVARAKGIEVEEIDLLPIGGVSRMERIPEAWRDETAIAIAGPLASIAIGLTFAAVGLAAGVQLLPVDPWSGPLLARLAWANLALAAFNLLPAFPLDGGRVLRAQLERRAPRVVATRRAGRVSRVLAAGMIAAGLFWNVWLVIIGAFVIFACKAEETEVLVHAALDHVPASALAFPSPIVMPAGWRSGAAAQVAAGHPQLAYPVVDSIGEVIGAVTAVDLHRAPPTRLVGDIAGHDQADAAEALDSLAERMQGGAAVVTEGRRVIGVITPEILVGYLNQRSRELGV
jgi:stage IV sporulation protein FB